MCGKPNPAEGETCQYCQARLKPLRISPLAEPPKSSPPPAILPDDLLQPEEGGESELLFRVETTLPDWLREAREDETTQTAQPPTEAKDWLTDLRAGIGTGSLRQEDDLTAESAEDFEEIASGELPEWLRGDVTTSEGEAETPSPESRAPEAETFEWSPPARTDYPPEEELSLPHAETEPEIPDWLAGLLTKSEQAETTPSPEVPDWLAEMRSEVGPSPQLPTVEEEEPAAVLPAAQMPEWLAEFAVTQPSPTPTPAFEEQPLLTEAETARDSSPDYTAELPDWLSQAPEEAPAILETTVDRIATLEVAEAEPALAPSALPEWLEAMRPVEAVTPPPPPIDESSAKVEASGPLAGLRGVLSAEPEIAALHKPATYSVKVQVSEKQRQHVVLLKKMLELEGVARPLPLRQIITPQHIMRGAIAFVLIIVVLWMLLSGSQRSPLPFFPSETAEVNLLIRSLPENAKVLIAFDYQPGLLGEMDAAAAAVLDHLMVRGAYLTLISTSPAGPILAERLIRDVHGEHHYLSGQQYVNLGYIAGGPSGLRSFAESPQRTLPLTLESTYAWGREGAAPLPPLQGITRLSDYSLVLIITDDAETARAWIEQVRPSLTDAQGRRNSSSGNSSSGNSSSGNSSSETPLAMIISAQAEPMVLPYYQASPRQVQGLVTGLRGSAAYARLTGRSGLSSAYWEAFSAGLVVAVLLISISGLINLLSTTLPGLKAAISPAPPTGTTVPQAKGVKKK
jgi:hypothetical protein